MRSHSIFVLCALAMLPGCKSPPKDPQTLPPVTDTGLERMAVIKVLDTLHESAAKADLIPYLACFAPDAVFLGTDSGERWTMGDWAKYCEYRFKQGKGWTYTPIPARRFVTIAADGHAAWFDEALMNEKYGETRGSGTLRRSPTGWQIVQYNLTIPIPNALAERVVQIIREASPPKP